MRVFELRSQRDNEKVAEGCMFSDGSVAVRWQRKDYPNSSVWWNSIEDAELIHTGIGSWNIVWID